MSKCDCWHKYPASAGLEYYTGRCYGTKEQEYCQCNGDTSKCDFYPEKRNKCEYYKSYSVNGLVQVNECGRNDHTSCKCNGDKNKCDYNYFVKNKGKKNKPMKTLEMMNAAKENGKTYWNEANDILYSAKYGFTELFSNNPVATIDFDGYFNDFMVFTWAEVNTMTRSEAEEKYGIKIIG